MLTILPVWAPYVETFCPLLHKLSLAEIHILLNPIHQISQQFRKEVENSIETTVWAGLLGTAHSDGQM